MLTDYLAKLPTPILTRVELTDNKVFLPTRVDSESFYELHKQDIESTTLTHEKCIYLASTQGVRREVTSKIMLTKGYYR